MAIAYDAFSADAGLDTGTPTWTHTPVGAPRGVVVFVMENAPTGADGVTGITYGGIPMTNCAGSPFGGVGGGEWQIIHAFHLGSGIPSGAQTVIVSVSAGTAKLGVSVSATATNNTQVAAIDGDSSAASGSPVTATLDTAGGLETFCCAAAFSGTSDLVNLNFDASMTSIGAVDHGVYTDRWGRKTINPTGGSYTVSVNANGDAINLVAVALSEVGGFEPVRQRHIRRSRGTHW